MHPRIRDRFDSSPLILLEESKSGKPSAIGIRKQLRQLFLFERPLCLAKNIFRANSRNGSQIAIEYNLSSIQPFVWNSNRESLRKIK